MNKKVLIFIGYLFSKQVLAVNYSFTDLGTLGGSFSFATSISNSGYIVGISALPRDSNSGIFLWKNGTMSALPNNFYGTPVVNNLGIVGGQGIVDHPISNWAYRSKVWDGSKIEYLDAVPGTHHSWITAINDSGQYAGPSIVVKELFPLNEDYHATRWDGSVAVDLGPGYAWGINDNGDVVGSIEIEGGSQAALWSGSNVVNLGTLGGKYSQANSINNAGQIVGRADISISTAYHHATLWDGNTILDLGTLGGLTSEALAINDSGIIVGWAGKSDGSPRATFWDGTQAVDLNTLIDPAIIAAGWILEHASDINNQGWIVGHAANSSLGIWRQGFLLKPVPLPNTIWLFFSGFGWIVAQGGMRRLKIK